MFCWLENVLQDLVKLVYKVSSFSMYDFSCIYPNGQHWFLCCFDQGKLCFWLLRKLVGNYFLFLYWPNKNFDLKKKNLICNFNFEFDYNNVERVKYSIFWGVICNVSTLLCLILYWVYSSKEKLIMGLVKRLNMVKHAPKVVNFKAFGLYVENFN